MKNVYIIDTAGRVSIPVKIRNQLGWQSGDNIIFTVADGKLIVEKIKFTAKEENLEE